VDGKADDLPESVFLYVRDIDEVRAKTKEMKQATWCCGRVCWR